MISKELVSLLATLIWGVYALVVGLSAIYYGYSNDLMWIASIVAIIGNSAHLVAMHYSSQGLTIQAQGSSPPGPPKSA